MGKKKQKIEKAKRDIWFRNKFEILKMRIKSENLEILQFLPL